MPRDDTHRDPSVEAELLHFTSRREWERAKSSGQYAPDAMEADGFVHLSFGHQVAAVATALAPGADDLVLLVVDANGLETDLRVEGGFPHLYRPVPLSAVRLVAEFPPEADGSFVVPEEARIAELTLTALPSFDAVLERCRAVTGGFDRHWWVGGGWAVDAATGTVSRPHLDVDLVILRPDVHELGRHLDAWDVRLPRSGSLVEWDRREFTSADHQLWLRPDDGHRPARWQDFAGDPGFLEILVEQFDAAQQQWAFRRNGAVRDPLERLGPSGGFLRPEVALLYKAAAVERDDPAGRAKAQADFAHGAPHLDEEQRRWLTEALSLVHGRHPWIQALERG